MFHTLLAGAVAVVAWLAWHIVGDVVGEAFGYALRPLTRPLWRAVVRARFPWPLALGLLGGVGAAVAGVRLMHYEDWRATAGGLLFFGGSGLALLAPLLWRDARVEAQRVTGEGSRSVV
jgi:hypothetical protein